MSDLDSMEQGAPIKSLLRPLAFGWSLLVTVVALIVARELVQLFGFSGFRMFSEGAIWWQVLIYFVTAVGLYVGALVVINKIRGAR